MIKPTDLREILRYIPRFRDKVFVIGIDGQIVEDENFSNLLMDIAVLRSLNIKVVLVHGASHQIKVFARQTAREITNADGTTSFTWTASFNDSGGSSWGSNLRSQTFGLEVTVDDGNGQPVSSLAVIRVYNRQERIRLPQYRFLFAPGETFSVEAIVETIDGEPVRGRTLTATISQYNYTSRNYQAPYTTIGVTTDERGRATLNLTLSGQDSKGRVIT